MLIGLLMGLLVIVPLQLMMVRFLVVGWGDEGYNGLKGGARPSLKMPRRVQLGTHTSSKYRVWTLHLIHLGMDSTDYTIYLSRSGHEGMVEALLSSPHGGPRSLHSVSGHSFFNLLAMLSTSVPYLYN